MAVILPFEKKFYQGHGVDVDFVGNPLLDQVQTALTPAEFKVRHNIAPDSTVIGIMPGSRRQEIAKILPLFLQAAVKLDSEIEKCVFLLPLAETLTEDDMRMPGNMGENLDIRIIKDQRYEAMAACDAAMAASGTLTMELALLKVPMVVCYRVATISYLLAKPFIKVKYASLVNLVAEKEVVPELLQYEATSENIYTKMLYLLTSRDAREVMRQELELVCERLGEPGASKRAAKLAFAMMAAEQ